MSTAPSIQRSGSNKNEIALQVLVEQGWKYQRKNNYKLAMAYFRVAANEGSPSGWYALSRMYEANCGVPENLQEAKKFSDLIRMRAERGHALAQYYLGRIYWDGCLEAPQGQKAHKHFKIAAEAECVEAHYFLGIITYQYNEKIQYFVDDPIDEDISQKLQCASDQGHAIAQINLAAIYKTRLQQDSNKIRELYQRFKDQLYRKKLYDERILSYYQQAIDNMTQAAESYALNCIRDMKFRDYGRSPLFQERCRL